MADPEYKLYVGNLSYSVTNTDLEERFKDYHCLSATVISDRETNQSRGFGFVTVTSIDDLDLACKEQDNMDFMDRKIKVSEAKNKNDGGGRGGGRDGGGRRGGYSSSGYGGGGGSGGGGSYGGSGGSYGGSGGSYGGSGGGSYGGGSYGGGSYGGGGYKGGRGGGRGGGGRGGGYKSYDRSFEDDSYSRGGGGGGSGYNSRNTR